MAPIKYLSIAVFLAALLPFQGAPAQGLNTLKLAFQPEPAPCIARYMLMRNSVPKGSPAEKALGNHILAARDVAKKEPGFDQDAFASNAQDIARQIHASVKGGKKTVDDVILETIQCDKSFELTPVFESNETS